MKRLLACGILALVGCGSGSDPTSSPDAPTSTGGNPDSGSTPIGDAPATPSTCVMTFTGGFSGKAGCTASGNNTSGLGQFRFNERSNANASGTDAARFHSASGGYSQQAAGGFAVGTFDGTNTLSDFGDLQTTDDQHFTGMGGTFTITDTGPSMTFGSTVVFANPHGTYTGVVTLSGQPDVQVSVTF